MFDYKIINALVIDGTGRKGVLTDVGIKGPLISETGDLSAAESKETVDAAGSVLSPGFIDVHTHSDAYLLVEPSAQSKLYQGVTTEVVGNCGASAYPLLGDYKMPSDWREQEYPGSWSSVAEYRALIEKVIPASNVYMLAGHNTLRAGVAGYQNRPLTADEAALMKRSLEQAFDEGVRGLSTGLIYSPGMFADTSEIESLAAIAAGRSGIYTSHMRSEGKNLLEAIDEAVGIGRRTGVSVEISHLKTSGKGNWGLLTQAMERIEQARADGLPVAADRYPYTSACTELDVIFPDWAAEGGSDAVLERLRSSSLRAKIRESLLKERPDDYWQTVVVGSTWCSETKPFQGVRLTDAAEMLGMHPVDAVLHITERDKLKTGAFFFGMSEDNMRTILQQPYVMIGSDASLRAPSGPLSMDHPHPRAYGSFTKFLRLVLDESLLSLEEAVRKMTSLPADHFDMKGRGRIAPGMSADIIIWNPDMLKENTSYTAPHALSEGIEYIWVNGVKTMELGALTGIRGGTVLA